MRQRRPIEACASRASVDARFCAIKDDGDAARGLTAPDGIRSAARGIPLLVPLRDERVRDSDTGQPTFEGERHVCRHSSGQGQGRQGRRTHPPDQGRRIPVISGVEGFMGYYVVYAPDDTVIAISLFNNFAAAEESNKRALAWIEQDLAPLLTGPATALAGPVIVHTLA